MVIKLLELENIGPFRFRPGAVDSVADFKARIAFDPDVNLFVGPNNVGKSTVLHTLDLLTERWTEEFCDRYSRTVRFPPDANRSNAAIEWSNQQSHHFRLETNFGVLAEIMRQRNQIHQFERARRGPARGPARGYVYMPEVGQLQCLDPEVWSRVCPYDQWTDSKNSDFGYVGYATHDSRSLRNGETLAQHLESGDRFRLDVSSTIETIIAKITSGFPMRIGVDRARGARMYRLIADQTPDGQVSALDLSLGTRYVLDWIIDFVTSFAERYARDPDWRYRPGIFIIDEIDAHLHPSWQRRIIPTLKESFPNVQIFASTHSPMMVAGLRMGQVHLLNRDDTGMVTWSRNERDVVGWTADEIYRTFMGVGDPTDERTASHVQELRRLRGKGTLTSAEEQRMQQLRELVNQDLLARGSLNAQRERFDAVMQDFLRSRMSDLSQDGG